MPTKHPHGQERTLEQTMAHQALTHRRRRMAHVHSRVKRWRMVKESICLRKEGVRDRMMARCCALHHVRVRLTPWQPRVEAGYTQVSWRAYHRSFVHTRARDPTAHRPCASHMAQELLRAKDHAQNSP